MESNKMTAYFIDYLETPIGCLYIQASNLGIKRVLFVESKTEVVNKNNWTEHCKTQLSEYFQKKRQVFHLPLDQEGTLFQKEVWGNLINIAFGHSVSYGDIARWMKNPKAVRAVGAANGKNPISIIVPCHRVIGNNGKLTGYAGGLERKAWLLTHESINYQ